MGLTPRNFLDEQASLEATTFADWTSEKKAQRVPLLKSALRWAWKTRDPRFAFAFTVDSDTVTVTNGKISLGDLGDGTWCSLWTENPMIAGNSACRVQAVVGPDGVYPTSEETSVFAFYRKVVPVITYTDDASLDEPDDIPEALLDLVTIRSLCQLHLALGSWDALNALKSLYGEPEVMRERLVIAQNISGVPWQDHVLAVTAAAA